MRIIDEKATEEHWHKREIRIEDGPIEKVRIMGGYIPNAGKDFQVDLITAKWDHGETPERIELFGQILLASGNTGKVRACVTYQPQASDGWLYPGLPEWALELLAGKVPLPAEGNDWGGRQSG